MESPTVIEQSRLLGVFLRSYNLKDLRHGEQQTVRRQLSQRCSAKAQPAKDRDGRRGTLDEAQQGDWPVYGPEEGSGGKTVQRRPQGADRGLAEMNAHTWSIVEAAFRGLLILGVIESA